MAKNDNLKDFLTDVANAIREKKGTTDLINPQDFSAEIASIKSGGGAVAVSAKAVNFRDYDGTILHSYTKDEFLALTELPPLPTREGLICQEWNWDFADAVEYVSEYGVLEVGATYVTDDGKTRLYITIAAEGRMDVPLYFSQTVANGVTIDWGDSSEKQTLSDTGNVNTTHKYEAIGDYVISLEVAEGCTLGFGRNLSSYCVMGSTGNNGRVYCNMLQKVEIGKGVTYIENYAFYYCYSLSSIVLPKGVTNFGQSVFYYCYPLTYAVLPKGFQNLGGSTFSNCYSLSSVSLPRTLKSIANNVFYYCYSLVSVILPDSLTEIGSALFYYCYSLSSVTMPNSITIVGSNNFLYCHSLSSIIFPKNMQSLGSYSIQTCYSLSHIELGESITELKDGTIQSCYSLSSIVLPKGLAKLGNGVFTSGYGMAFYDFSALESVPTLSTSSAFTNHPSDCKIIVPDALYDEWIAATNWSTSNISSKIIKKSEWDALNA